MLLRFQQRFLSRRPHLVFCAFRHRIQSTLFVTGAATLSVTIFCHAGRNGVVHSLCHGCRHVVVCVCCDAVCVSLCHAAGGPATALTSAATLSSTVAVTGAATLSLTLAVAQAATVTATLSVVQTTTLTSAAMLQSTLSVTDVATLSTTLAVTQVAPRLLRLLSQEKGAGARRNAA
jgi:hypothetical protein